MYKGAASGGSEIKRLPFDLAVRDSRYGEPAGSVSHGRAAAADAFGSFMRLPVLLITKSSQNTARLR